jgi:hypothetical protein
MYGIFCKPIGIWITDLHTEQPEQFDTEHAAQDVVDAWNENARSAFPPDSNADPEPYEVRLLPSDADLSHPEPGEVEVDGVLWKLS